MNADQQARRIEQLERDNFDARRIIEKLTARLERLEAAFGCPRPPIRYELTANTNTANRTDPLGR